MGTVGDAYDNAMAESVFASLEMRADRATQLQDEDRSATGCLHLD